MFSPPILTKFGLINRFFLEVTQYQISHKTAQWWPRCYMRMDGRTDLKKEMGTFTDYAKALKTSVYQAKRSHDL
jgi:hypothetical protein